MFQNKIALVVSGLVAAVVLILLFGHLGGGGSSTNSGIPSGDNDPSLLQPPPPGSSPEPTKQMTVMVNFYGFLDNSPPSNQIDYAVLHDGGAGGTGTYQDPITFATEPGVFRVGTIIYYPALQRYFVMEDSCEECTQDWTGNGPDGGPRFRRIDLWAGGDANSGQALTSCEDKLSKPQATIIANPPDNLPVATGPIFDATTKTCIPG